MWTRDEPGTDAGPWRAAAGVHLVEVAGQPALVDRRGETAHLLNRAGVEAWTRLSEGGVVDGEADAAFVATLAGAGLVVRPEADEAGASVDPFARVDRTLTDRDGQRRPSLGPPVAPHRHRAGPYRALEFDFVVHCDDDEVAGLVEAVFDPLRSPTPGAEVYHFELFGDGRAGRCGLRFNGFELRPVLDVEVAFVGLLAHLNQAALWSTDRRFTLHGGAVSIGGRAGVLLGGSGRGKSTVVTSLLTTGARYLTDEVVWLLVDARRPMVRPHPKPIVIDALPGRLANAVRRDAVIELGPGLTLIATGRLGPQVEDPVPLGVVFDVRYVPGMVGVSTRQLGVAERLALLLASSFAIECFDQAAADALAAAACRPTFSVRYGGHEGAANEITARLEGR